MMNAEELVIKRTLAGSSTRNCALGEAVIAITLLVPSQTRRKQKKQGFLMFLLLLMNQLYQ